MNIEQMAREAQRQVIGEDIGGKQWLERFAALVRAQALEEAAALFVKSAELTGDADDFTRGFAMCARNAVQAIRALKASPDAEVK